MRIVRSDEVEALSGDVPAEPSTLLPHWLEGPFNGDRLDVGMVTLSAGGATPPHVHIGGQVIVVTAGNGYVDVGGERHELGPGDVVITPPGEEHVHGALPGESFSHLTVTTGGYSFGSATAVAD
jgi:quercetin dioxygenase-like cupin family protein